MTTAEAPGSTAGQVPTTEVIGTTPGQVPTTEAPGTTVGWVPTTEGVGTTPEQVATSEVLSTTPAEMPTAKGTGRTPEVSTTEPSGATVTREQLQSWWRPQLERCPPEPAWVQILAHSCLQKVLQVRGPPRMSSQRWAFVTALKT